MRIGRLVCAAGIAALLTGGQLAQAALVSCPASFTADVTAKVFYNASDTAASACEYISPADNNNVANLININLAGFFGTSTWTDNAGQVQMDPGDTWEIIGANFAANDYAIVFKDGQDTNLIAFLFNEEATSGLWNTPFTEPPFDLSGGSVVHDVSHYSVIQRTSGFPPPPPPPPPPPIPEPATLVLMGIGFLGAGFMRRRR